MKGKLFIWFLFFGLAVKGQEKNANTYDSLKAANPQKIQTVFKTNPGAIFWGSIPLLTAEYRVIAETTNGINQSSQVGISYLGKSPYIKLFESDSAINPRHEKLLISGFRIQGSYRFFFNRWFENFGLTDGTLYSPCGFYLSPFISYSTAKITNNYFNTQGIFMMVTHYNINLLSGFQFFIFDNFSFDVFTGLGYKSNIWVQHLKNGVTKQVPPDDLKDIPFYNSPLKISLGINLGYGF